MYCRKIAIIFFLSLTLANTAWASTTPTPQKKNTPAAQTLSQLATLTEPASVPMLPKIYASSYILIDTKTQQIIAAKAPEQSLPPASLTKLMSLYLISDALKIGQIHMKDQVPVSVKAWRSKGSRMFIREGRKVPVQDLIHGISVQSGNDATIAMAEYLSGSEESFVMQMNQMAKKLDLKKTHYQNPTGLPVANHYTNASDLARLANHIITDFPEYYPWYKMKSFTYNKIKQNNRNKLLWKTDYVDGLKTGYTKDAGYCLASSGAKDHTRFILILMGEPSNTRRFIDAQTLFSYAFRFFHTSNIIKQKDTLLTLPVYYGQSQSIKLGVSQDVFKTLTQRQSQQLDLKFVHPKTLDAPIVKGKSYGYVNIFANHVMMGRYPLVAQNNIATGPFYRRWIDAVKKEYTYWFN